MRISEIHLSHHENRKWQLNASSLYNLWHIKRRIFKLSFLFKFVILFHLFNTFVFCCKRNKWILIPRIGNNASNIFIRKFKYLFKSGMNFLQNAIGKIIDSLNFYPIFYFQLCLMFYQFKTNKITHFKLWISHNVYIKRFTFTICNISALKDKCVSTS